MAIDSKILLVAHCGHYQLVVKSLLDAVSRIDLQVVTDSAQFGQQLFAADSLAEDAVYNHQSQVLVILHGNCTVTVWKLKLDINNKTCEHRLLRTVKVPYGLRLSEHWFGEEQVLLFRNVSAQYSDYKVCETQLVFVDTSTGQTQTAYVPVDGVKEISGFKRSIAILTSGENSFELSGRRLDLSKAN